MSKLTIEQKAKAYDKAIKRAKALYDNNQPISGNNVIIDNIFPELRKSEDEYLEIIKKDIISYLNNRKIDTIPESSATEKWINWIEKEGEYANFCNKIQVGDKVTRNRDGVLVNLSQLNRIAKPANKIDPKFKVGDFIVNDYCMGKVIELTGDAYLLDTGQGIPFSCEHNAHLWTIADAKGGDVLSDGTTIFIFKDLLSDGSVMSYCDYDTDSGESDTFCPLSMNLICSKITPATKKQRDLLFQKMKDSSYKWNAEKKELKKIEEEINGEDYGIDSLYHAQRILEKTLGSVDGYQSDDGILEHKCAIAAVKKLYKQNSSWSEDDEKILKKIIQDYEAASKSYCGHQGKLEWLKSLRPQPKQEWSEEDDDFFNDTIAFLKDTKNALDHVDWLKSLKQRIVG